jgi:hypothetical protein
MIAAIACSAFAVASTAIARCLVTIAPGDDVRSKMDEANANSCSVYFQPGVHTTTSRLGYTLVGTRDDPIEIYGDSAATTRLLRPNANQNILDLSGSHFVVRDLSLEGGSRGLRLENSVDHATLTRLVIHDTADAAVTANTAGASYTRLVISHSEIYATDGTGECMYLGCNNNGCTMGDSRVEFNYCRDTNSAQGPGQGDGIDLKGGAYNVLIRHNVLRDIFGPGILTYANGGGVQNVIEGNVIWNTGDVGIQFTGDAIVRNNVVIQTAPDRRGINGSGNNQGVPTNVQVINNTVIGTATGTECMALRGWGVPADNMVLANNALYCESGVALFMASGTEGNVEIFANAVVRLVSNVSSGTFAGGVPADQFEAVTNANLYPLPGSVLLGAGNTLYAPDQDFNCLPRPPTRTDVGAYQRSDPGNPGWTGLDDFKACLGSVFGDRFEE